MRPLIAFWNMLLRFGFRLLYNEAAFTYDLVSWTVSLGEWRCWTRSVLEFLPDPETGPVLELAHGTGNLQLDLAEHGYITFGIDLSHSMGLIARDKLRQRGKPAYLARAESQALPFADKRFAALVSTFPTEFILDPATLDGCRRVLQPDGVLVIVPNAILSSSGIRAKMIDLLYRLTGQRGSSASEQRLASIFSRHGFELRILETSCPNSRVTVMVATSRVTS